jgi:ATP phosphoribosyltransferase regulatory subunit HisZ
MLRRRVITVAGGITIARTAMTPQIARIIRDRLDLRKPQRLICFSESMAAKKVSR